MQRFKPNKTRLPRLTAKASGSSICKASLICVKRASTEPLKDLCQFKQIVNDDVRSLKLVFLRKIKATADRHQSDISPE